jgi:subtilase family serine protease
MKHAPIKKLCPRLWLPLLVLTLLASSFFSFSIVWGRGVPPAAQPQVLQQLHHLQARLLSQKTVPPTDAECRAKHNTPCYSPQEMWNAYNLTSLLNAGYNGAGQTIVIIDSFGSPTLTQDLYSFDQGYGLPDPPSLQIYTPLGTVPFDPTNTDQSGWAFETTLDVEWAHAIAPRASIVLLLSPVSETEGVQGMPEFLQLEQYALKRHMGSIISQSWGATENTLFDPAGKKVLQDYDRFYAEAAKQHVTILASSGDTGVVNPDVQNKNYPFPTVLFPASSPWVTAVGGTSLYLDTSGKYLSETVWNDGHGSASGGGISQYYTEPNYQRAALTSSALRSLVHGYRAVPDISYNADTSTGVVVYMSFMGQKQAGYYLIGGTSEGAPQWAGIVAIANQKAGHPLGFLNDALYQLGRCTCTRSAFRDITHGNNSSDKQTGYPALPGWDAATGWGTPNAGLLVPALANLL